MGRLGKKMIDRIRAMLAEGYSKTETATELGIDRKTVASYAVDTESPLRREDSGARARCLGLSARYSFLLIVSYLFLPEVHFLLPRLF